MADNTATESNDLGSVLVAHQLDELRERRVARTADRTAFAERRLHGLTARHAAKLAWLTAREELRPEQEQESSTESLAETDVA